MCLMPCEQQRRRSPCASAQTDQRLCCSLPRQNDTSSLYIRNFKILAGLCSLAGQFVSCLVRNSRRHVLSCRGLNVRNILLAICSVFLFHIILSVSLRLTQNLNVLKMNQVMTKPTKWQVRPAKTQISLGIHPA